MFIPFIYDQFGNLLIIVPRHGIILGALSELNSK